MPLTPDQLTAAVLLLAKKSESDLAIYTNIGTQLGTLQRQIINLNNRISDLENKKL